MSRFAPRQLALAVAVASLGSFPALADSTLPAGGEVSAGAASIGTAGSAMTINQASQRGEFLQSILTRHRYRLSWQSDTLYFGFKPERLQPNQIQLFVLTFFQGLIKLFRILNRFCSQNLYLPDTGILDIDIQVILQQRLVCAQAGIVGD